MCPSGRGEGCGDEEARSRGEDHAAEADELGGEAVCEASREIGRAHVREGIEEENGSCLLRRKSLVALQEKGHENAHGAEDQIGGDASRDGEGEIPIPEEREIHEGNGRADLPEGEKREEDRRREKGPQDGRRRPTQLASSVQGDQESEKAEKTRGTARKVEFADAMPKCPEGVPLFVRGKKAQGCEGGQGSHGEVDEKDPPP